MGRLVTQNKCRCAGVHVCACQPRSTFELACHDSSIVGELNAFPSLRCTFHVHSRWESERERKSGFGNFFFPKVSERISSMLSGVLREVVLTWVLNVMASMMSCSIFSTSYSSLQELLTALLFCCCDVGGWRGGESSRESCGFSMAFHTQILFQWNFHTQNCLTTCCYGSSLWDLFSFSQCVLHVLVTSNVWGCLVFMISDLFTFVKLSFGSRFG